MDAVEKLLPEFGGEPCLRIGSFAGPFRVSVRLSAGGASTATRPPRTGAVAVPRPHRRQGSDITARPSPIFSVPKDPAGIHPLGAAAAWVSGPMRAAACAS